MNSARSCGVVTKALGPLCAKLGAAKAQAPKASRAKALAITAVVLGRMGVL
jgi:hypothetical protein